MDEIRIRVTSPDDPVFEGLAPTEWMERRRAEIFLSTEELRSRKAAWPAIEPQESGIYFLWRGDELLYIGLSGNIIHRLEEHKRGGMPFDAFSYVLVPDLIMPTVERRYIKSLAPPLNTRWHPRRQLKQ
jgi:hypothetical protein